jgi:hypothetical protein
MTRENFDNLPEAERAHFYECPACGEMVDNRRADEVRLHHDHVLRPRPSDTLPVMKEHLEMVQKMEGAK